MKRAIWDGKRAINRSVQRFYKIAGWGREESMRYAIVNNGQVETSL